MLPYLPDSGGAVFLRAKFQIFRRKRNLWRGRSKASHCLNSYFGAPPNGKRSKLLISRSRGVRGREGQKWGEEGEAERWEGWWLLGFGIWDLGRVQALNVITILGRFTGHTLTVLVEMQRGISQWR